jgi:outer membrane protein OmpA-like peptidoglycan-associated protein
MKKHFFLLAAAFCAAHAPRAENLEHRRGVGGWLGGTDPLGSRSFDRLADGGPAGGVWVRWGLTPRLQRSVSLENLSFSDRPRVQALFGSLWHLCTPHKSWSPVQALGVGPVLVRHGEIVSAGSYATLGAKAALGVESYPSPKVAIGVLVQLHSAFPMSRDSRTFHALSAGFMVTYFVGPSTLERENRPNTPAPLPPPVTLPPAPTAGLAMEWRILFEGRKAEPPAGVENDLEAAAVFLKNSPAATVSIEGHTDNQGAEPANQTLSQRRAEAVRNILVRRFGIAASRLAVRGAGAARPVADNGAAAGRATNSRVTLTIAIPPLPPEETK